MSGQFINHFGAVRLRLNGSGNLKLKLISMDDVQEQVLTEIAMSSATNKYPTVLANFNQPRARLRLETTVIDETFSVGEILIYVKPVFTSYPQ